LSRPSCPELFLSSSNLSLVAHPNHCIPHFSLAPLVDIFLYSTPARILQPTMASCRRCRVRMIAGQITAAGVVRAAQAGKKGSRAEHLRRGCPCRPGLAAGAVGSARRTPGQGCNWYVRAACWPPGLGRDACLSSVQGLAAGQVAVAGRAVRSPLGLDLLLGWELTRAARKNCKNDTRKLTLRLR